MFSYEWRAVEAVHITFIHKPADARGRFMPACADDWQPSQARIEATLGIVQKCLLVHASPSLPLQLLSQRSVAVQLERGCH